VVNVSIPEIPDSACEFIGCIEWVTGLVIQHDGLRSRIQDFDSVNVCLFHTEILPLRRRPRKPLKLTAYYDFLAFVPRPVLFEHANDKPAVLVKKEGHAGLLFDENGEKSRNGDFVTVKSVLLSSHGNTLERKGEKENAIFLRSTLNP